MKKTSFFFVIKIYENCVNSGIRGQPPVRSHGKHDESMTLKGVEEGKRD